MRLVGGKRTESWWLYAIAGVLLVAGPLWRELFVSRYPLRPEVFVLLVLAAAAGALAAIGSRLLGGLAGSILFGGLLFIFTDLQLDLHREVRTVFLVAGCLALSLLLTSYRAAITSLALGAFYLSSLIRPGVSPPSLTTTTATNSARGPLLLHVILDEQWGIGGLRAAGDSATAGFLTRFYLDRGFEVYESAYSRYEMTKESIPDALSLGGPTSLSSDLTSRGFRYFWRMSRNPYFAKLREMGYDIRVYQSTYLDLCGDSTVVVVACNVQAGNSIANIGFIDGSWVTRGRWVARYYLDTRSHVFAKLSPQESVWDRSVAGGAVAGLHRLTRAIEQNPATGSAYFAHVLLPHRPVHMNAQCRVLDDPSEMVGYDLPADISESRWQAALLAYAGQVRCAHQLLADVIDAVDRVAGRDNSIVIVHGDHGVRMHRNQPAGALDTYTPDQLNASFSTLLAVRRPNVAAAIRSEPTPVQDFVWEFTRRGFIGTPVAEWRHELRKGADSANATGVNLPLGPGNMLWARRPD